MENQNAQVRPHGAPSRGTPTTPFDLPRSQDHGANLEQNPTLSPGFLDLLAENRALRDQLNWVRIQLAVLAGRHERDGAIPVEKIEALLSERWPS